MTTYRQQEVEYPLALLRLCGGISLVQQHVGLDLGHIGCADMAHTAVVVLVPLLVAKIARIGYVMAACGGVED